MTSKLNLTRHIANLYARGENVLQHLRQLEQAPSGQPVNALENPVDSPGTGQTLDHSEGRAQNSVEDIMISYDFQAGTYIRAYENDPTYLDRYTDELACIFAGLGPLGTVLEAGCGESTTLSVLGNKLAPRPSLGGFDISWSRVKLGSQFAARLGLSPTLFCADLFRIPLADQSVDVVYTSHSIEPNGGRERPAIMELARIARQWLILLEPAYDLAGEEARRRMEKHGYVKDLAATIRSLGLDLVEHRMFPVCANSLNPTGLYLVRVGTPTTGTGTFRFQCPISGTALDAGTDAYYSPESFLAYPVLAGVPCLLENNAILATKFQSAAAKR